MVEILRFWDYKIILESKMEEKSPQKDKLLIKETKLGNILTK